jgi:hypothetical protein
MAHAAPLECAQALPGNRLAGALAPLRGDGIDPGLELGKAAFIAPVADGVVGAVGIAEGACMLGLEMFICILAGQ